MSLLQLTRISVGQVGVKPGDVKMVTTDNYATITAAGYLNGIGNQLPEVNLSPSDVIECLYSYNTLTDTGSLAYFLPTITNGVITLTVQGNPGDVTLPVVSGNFSVFSGTTGLMHDAGFLPSDASKTRVVMAGSATVIGLIAHFVDVTGTIDDTAGAVSNLGDINAGASGTQGSFIAWPTTASNGSFKWAAVGNAGNFAMTVSPVSTLGQASVITVPDPGAATANFMLDAGTTTAKTITTLTSTTANITNLKYGATPVAQVDPASCTIAAVSGAANTSTITIQLKDGSGTNMARVIPFKVYLATSNTGLTLQSAASTGYSVTSGGVTDPTGSTTITQGLAAFSSATGGCVISLLDTGKGTGNLILMLPNGFKASAAITAGSYG